MLLGRSRFEPGGRLLECLVFDELPDQIAARVGFLGRGFLLGVRQKHFAFNFHQRGGHDQKVAGQFDVRHLEDGDMPRELLGHRGDGDVEDVHLVFLDEVEQQVEGTVKLGQIDAVIHPWLAGLSRVILKEMVAGHG